MSMSTTLRTASFTFLVFSAAVARADDRAAATESGKAAAHAALSEAAELPAEPPKLPALAADGARKAQADTTFAKKGEATRRAHSQAAQHVADDARSAHIDAADRAAQGSVAAAARSANADDRAAAGQARAQAARANAAGHLPGATHPVPGAHP